MVYRRRLGYFSEAENQPPSCEVDVPPIAEPPEVCVTEEGGHGCSRRHYCRMLTTTRQPDIELKGSKRVYQVPLEARRRNVVPHRLEASYADPLARLLWPNANVGKSDPNHVLTIAAPLFRPKSRFKISRGGSIALVCVQVTW